MALLLLSACSWIDQRTEAEKGFDMLRDGDTAHAITHLQAANAAKPDDPYIQLDLAAAYERLGQFDKARPIYEKVLQSGKDARDADGKSLADLAAANLAKLPK
ncbi:MAG TPA: tetratricopeptide repeat protein [Aliidongia sp.]|nr:tetratricopeptide repeat protein [Aliidongia sp.]